MFRNKSACNFVNTTHQSRAWATWCQSTQGILLCLSPFLTCFTAYLYKLTCSVSLWSTFKCYHPPAMSLDSSCASYYNNTRWARMEHAKSSHTFQGWKWLEMPQPIGKHSLLAQLWDRNLQMVEQDKQLHVGMSSSAPKTVGPKISRTWATGARISRSHPCEVFQSTQWKFRLWIILGTYKFKCLIHYYLRQYEKSEKIMFSTLGINLIGLNFKSTEFCELLI